MAQDVLELLEFKLVEKGICEGCRKKVYDLIENIKAMVIEFKLQKVKEELFIFDKDLQPPSFFFLKIFDKNVIRYMLSNVLRYKFCL